MKQDRIELRASHKERDRLLEAAMFSGMTLSAFLRQAALEKSEDVLKSRDTLSLSDRDRDLFLSALEAPPKPNKSLHQAFQKYKKQKSGIKTENLSVKATGKKKAVTHKAR